MDKMNPLNQNVPFAVFDTHVVKDKVIFTLPVGTTLDSLVPLAKELLHKPHSRQLEASIEVNDGGSVVIVIGETSD